jgi:mRNA interferase RelE/StbE
MLAGIKDTGIRATILTKVKRLAAEPEKQEKPLQQSLKGLYSISAAGRCRIIYRLQKEQVIVLILAIGLRKEGDSKDIYVLARKLLKLGLI